MTVTRWWSDRVHPYVPPWDNRITLAVRGLHPALAAVASDGHGTVVVLAERPVPAGEPLPACFPGTFLGVPVAFLKAEWGNRPLGRVDDE